MASSVKLNLSISETSYSIPNNKSNISYSLSVTSVNAHNGFDNQCPWVVRTGGPNGTIIASGYKGFANNTTTQLYSGTINDISHNPDGTGSITLYAHYTTGVSPAQADVYSTKTLTTIPRKTECPSLSGYIGSSYNLTLNKKSSSFTSALYITFGEIKGWLQADGSIGSNRYNFSTSNPLITIPKSFYSQFDGISKIGTMTLYTRSGNTDIGSDSKELNAVANTILCTPIATGEACDVNSKTLSLTGDKKNVISQMSNVKVDFNITRISDIGDNNAKITSITLDNVINVPITDRTFTIVGATKTQYKLTITNSRGGINSFFVNTGGELIPYVPLTISSNFYRNEPTTGEVTAEYSGNYWSGVFGETVIGTGDDTKAALDNVFNNVVLDTTLVSTDKEIVKRENKLVLTYQYRLQGYSTEWSDEYPLESYTINKTNFTYDGVDALINHNPSGETGHDNFDYSEAYEFRIHYKDALVDGWTDAFLVARGIPVYWWSKDSVHIEGDLYVKDQNFSKINAFCVARLSSRKTIGVSEAWTQTKIPFDTLETVDNNLFKLNDSYVVVQFTGFVRVSAIISTSYQSELDSFIRLFRNGTQVDRKEMINLRDSVISNEGFLHVQKGDAIMLSFTNNGTNPLIFETTFMSVTRLLY